MSNEKDKNNNSSNNNEENKNIKNKNIKNNVCDKYFVAFISFCVILLI